MNPNKPLVQAGLGSTIPAKSTTEYPLEVVVQVAAILATNRPIHKAAIDAVFLLRACEKALGPASLSPSFSEIAVARLKEARQGFPKGSFETEVRRITKSKTKKEALSRIVEFLRYEIECERQPTLEQLTKVHDFQEEQRLRTVDEQIQLRLAMHKAAGLGGAALDDFKGRYMNWYLQIFRKKVKKRTETTVPKVVGQRARKEGRRYEV